MKTPLVVLGWGLTLAAAFFAGRALSDSAEVPRESQTAASDREESLDRRVGELTRLLEAERNRAARAAPARERNRGTDSSESAADAPGDTPASAAATVDTSATFSMDGVTTGPELSKRLMAYVDAQYARGPDGYPAILQALNTMWNSKETMKELFQDESAMSRELYPWIKMLVRRESETVGLTEFVFRNMAEKPEYFADTPDADVLELFTEGMAFLLPGVVPEERLAVFRAYAKKVLDTPQDKQPKAVTGNRSEIQRLLERLWREPLTPEEALAKLDEAGLQAREIGQLVRAVTPEMRAKLDLTAIVAKLLSQGDDDAIGLLNSPPFDQLDRVRLDRAFLEGLGAGSFEQYSLGNYVRRTARRSWGDVRSLIDSALGLGSQAEASALGAIAESLPKNLRPDRAYVEDVISTRTIPADVLAKLKSAYSIQ